MIVSNEIKRRAGWKCVCGNRKDLQTHHTEEGDKYHGEEHLLLQEGRTGLECICGKCHKKLHNTSVKDAEKKRQRNKWKENILNQLPYYPSRISEEEISGSSVSLTRNLLEEMEHERKVIISRDMYEGWRVYRCT